MFEKIFGTKIVIISTGKSAYIKAHGKKQEITNNDIPRIIESGPGKIVVKMSKWGQTMDSSGMSGISCIQTNDRLLINGVDVFKLLKKI